MPRIRVAPIVLVLLAITSTALAQRGDADPMLRDILQRKDKALRAERLDELHAALGGSSPPGERLAALNRLRQLSDIRFDREPFRVAVKRQLADSSAEIRAAALAALPVAGGDANDLPDIAKLAADESPAVRRQVVMTLFFCGKTDGQATIWPVVEKLLDDKEKEVKLGTLHALWGHAISPAAEAKVIAMSRESMNGGPGAIGYDAVYYALSTRPVVSLPVAERLIELLAVQDFNLSGRAAWGLGNHAAPDAVNKIVAALVHEFDESNNPQMRSYALQGLIGHRTPAALEKLRDIAANEESESLRATAARAIQK